MEFVQHEGITCAFPDSVLLVQLVISCGSQKLRQKNGYFNGRIREIIQLALIPLLIYEIHCIVSVHKLLYTWLETRCRNPKFRFVSLDRVSELLLLFILLKVCSQMYVLAKREVCMSLGMIAGAAEAIAVE